VARDAEPRRDGRADWKGMVRVGPIVLGANYPAHTYPGGGMSARSEGPTQGRHPNPRTGSLR
jgi:hypothetical protein